MLKFLALVLTVLCWLCAAATAGTLTIPYTFSSGTTIYSSQVNANFASIASFALNIDNTNVGTLGFYASQIKPTSSAQATFGGSYSYTFPAGSIGIQYGGVNTVGIGVAPSSAAGGVNCSLFDVFQQASPYITAQCNDTSGDLGVAGYIESGNNVGAQVALGYPTATTTVPFVANSSDNGINLEYPSTSALGTRVISLVSGTPTLVAQFTANGAVIPGIYNQIGTSSGNGVLEVPGTGQLLLNYGSGGVVQIGNGSFGLSGTAFGTSGSATVGTSLGVGTSLSVGTGATVTNGLTAGSVSSNTTVAATTAVSAGTTVSAGTYLQASGHSVPFDPRYSSQANYHIEAGQIMNFGAGQYNITFTTPYANPPESCVVSAGSYAGSTPTTGVLFVKSYNGSGPYTGMTIQHNMNVTIDASYMCVGY